jgi:rSAM/selenodomain-associated transferase 2/rSAM/selenodomain-associated transferase 1
VAGIPRRFEEGSEGKVTGFPPGRERQESVKVSIVVPTLDEAPRLPDALLALAPMREAGHEVIVVDGGSHDGTVEIATPLADQVLVAPRGRAIQMNTGAAVASGTTLLFLHADCRLPASGVAAIEGTHAHGYRWGRFDVTLKGRSPLLPLVAAMMNRRSALSGICTGDQGIFVERALFEAVGGFPPIPLMEDIALSKALRRKAGLPKCVTDRITASGRRWDTHGAARTILTMWGLRLAYWRGAEPNALARRYYGAEVAPRATLQIFAKPPLPGLVKTRLAATIGNDAAAAVYRDLLLRTLAIAASARRAGIVRDVELWVVPDAEPGPLATWGEQLGIALRTQQGADLGERMRNALQASLAAGSPALLIGTDVPGLDIAYIARAAAALQANDAVIGPAEDGGYVLIGLARSVEAFEGVRWSTPDVMTQTRAKLAAAGVRWTELPVLWDLDTQEDLARWQALGGKDTPAAAAALT